LIKEGDVYERKKAEKKGSARWTGSRRRGSGKKTALVPRRKALRGVGKRTGRAAKNKRRP